MNPFEDAARRVLLAAGRRGVMVATVESCTGGMIVAALTEISGSSLVVDRGFVTYSNDAKVEMVGVSAETLAQHGAVSREVALEMSLGGLKRSKGEIAVAVTGIAGPLGGSPEKPVGLVWFGLASAWTEPFAEEMSFGDIGRDGIRRATVLHALDLLRRALEADHPSFSDR